MDARQVRPTRFSVGRGLREPMGLKEEVQDSFVSEEQEQALKE